MTENGTSVELNYPEEYMQKTYKRLKKYQVEIPAKIKKEVGLCARHFGTALTIRYNYVIKEKEMIVRGFNSAGILEDV